MTTEELQPLADWINDYYQGDAREVVLSLNRSISMLHHLPNEAFTKKEVQDVTFDLQKVAELLM